MPFTPTMREVKTILPTVKPTLVTHARMLETEIALSAEPHVTIYLEKNTDTDYVVVNPDGTVTRVGAIVGINGRQYIIPSQVKTRIPKTVYEVMLQSEEYAQRAKIIPEPRFLGIV